jgi:hypothetical protein
VEDGELLWFSKNKPCKGNWHSLAGAAFSIMLSCGPATAQQSFVSKPLVSTHHQLTLSRENIRFHTSTISLLSPGSLTRQPGTIEKQDKPFIQDSEYYHYFRPGSIEIVVGWVRLYHSLPDIQGAAKAVMQAISEAPRTTKFFYSMEPEIVLGLQGLRARASFEREGNKISMIYLAFSKGREAWHVGVFLDSQDKTTVKLADEVIKSININYH